MATDDFYDEQTEQSEIKTEIVRKYFWAWAKVISKHVKKRGNNKIGYVDLFSGPGRYDDGAPSTPILILEGAIRDSEIREMLIASFNDENSDNIKKLTIEVANIPDIDLLKNKPRISSRLVNDELALQFEGKTTIPTLFFLDPWGYKGLSLRLVKAVIQSWGCDCMFFFNYNRINAALSNEVMTNNMNAFFGVVRAEKLRAEIAGKTPRERECLIITGLKESLTEFGGEFSIEYFFKDSKGNKTSHFLIFVSKNVLGYDIMKSIMAKESSKKIKGVASFGFDPRDQQKRDDDEKTPFLFDMFESPIDDLANDLLLTYQGQTLTANEIYQGHHVGTQFVFKNYQDALRQLEAKGVIDVDPPSSERRKINGIVTFGENIVVIFPKREKENGY